MELFIRGAWRTFGERPDGHRPAQDQRTISTNSIATEMEALTGDLPCEAISKSSRPTWESIFTERVNEIKEFYETLTSCRAAFEHDAKCAIAYREHCYLMIMDSRKIKLSPEHSRTKAISLEYFDIEDFQKLYCRLLQLGITPVRTLRRGNNAVLEFADPDSNKVEVFATYPEPDNTASIWTVVDTGTATADPRPKHPQDWNDIELGTPENVRIKHEPGSQ